MRAWGNERLQTSLDNQLVYHKAGKTIRIKISKGKISILLSGSLYCFNIVHPIATYHSNEHMWSVSEYH